MSQPVSSTQSAAARRAVAARAANASTCGVPKFGVCQLVQRCRVEEDGGKTLTATSLATINPDLEVAGLGVEAPGAWDRSIRKGIAGVAPVVGTHGHDDVRRVTAGAKTASVAGNVLQTEHDAAAVRVWQKERRSYSHYINVTGSAGTYMALGFARFHIGLGQGASCWRRAWLASNWCRHSMRSLISPRTFEAWTAPGFGRTGMVQLMFEHAPIPTTNTPTPAIAHHDDKPSPVDPGGLGVGLVWSHTVVGAPGEAVIVLENLEAAGRRANLRAPVGVDGVRAERAGCVDCGLEPTLHAGVECDHGRLLGFALLLEAVGGGVHGSDGGLERRVDCGEHGGLEACVSSANTSKRPKQRR